MTCDVDTRSRAHGVPYSQATDATRCSLRSRLYWRVLMKRTPIIAALVLSTVSSAIAQQQSARPRAQASPEQAVRQQDQQRIHAQITADTLALQIGRAHV